MKRKDIRQLKRAARTGSDPHAMTVLLERSVRFGHKRLALLRCLQAERMGLCVTQDILSYCQEVADALAPEVVEVILRQVTASAVGSVHTASGHQGVVHG